MAITRAAAERELVDRAGGVMEACGLAVTYTGSNTALQSPMAYALRQMGLTASNPVTDANLASVTDEDQFFDLAELRLLKNCKRNFAAVNMSLGPRREDFDQLRQGLDRDIAQLEKQVRDLYGVGAAHLGYGFISVDFAEHDTGAEDDLYA